MTMTTDFEFWQDYLRNQSIVEDDSALFDEDVFSPQYQALDWLIHEDPVVVSNGLRDINARSALVDRYILAVLYFSTNGGQWKNNQLYLSGSSVCDWWGIGCDVTGSITRIVMCTYIVSFDIFA